MKSEDQIFLVKLKWLQVDIHLTLKINKGYYKHLILKRLDDNGVYMRNVLFILYH